LSLLEGLIEQPHRFRIDIARDVVDFDSPRCPGEHHLSAKILRLDSEHLGRMHFEAYCRFATRTSFEKQEFDDGTMLMSYVY
jgi:hypothetical protein